MNFILQKTAAINKEIPALLVEADVERQFYPAGGARATA